MIQNRLTFAATMSAIGLGIFMSAANSGEIVSPNCDFAINYPRELHMKPDAAMLSDPITPIIAIYKQERFEITYLCTPNTLFVLPTEEQMCGLMAEGEADGGKLVQCVYGAGQNIAEAMGFWEMPYENGGNFLLIERTSVSRRSRFNMLFSSFGLSANEREVELNRAMFAVKWVGLPQ